MKKYLSNMITLKQYLIVGISLLILFATAVLLVYPTSLYARLFTEQSEHYSLDIATQTSTGVSMSLYELDAKISRFIGDPAISGEIISGSLPEGEQEDLFLSTLLKYFSSNSMDYYYLQSIELYIEDSGAHLYHGSIPTNLANPFRSNYYETALKYPTGLSWVGYNYEFDCIDITRIIYDHSTYKVLGLLVMRLSKNFLFDKFKAFNTIEISNMYIVDDHGLILCSKDPLVLGKTLDASYTKILSGKSGSIHKDGKLIVYCYLGQATQSYPYRK